MTYFTPALTKFCTLAAATSAGAIGVSTTRPPSRSVAPMTVPVRPRPYRAFQGWRYLDVKDAPPDLDRVAKGTSNMPEPMRRELRELGLL